MDAKLTFLGAAQNVTGSCYLLETSSARILVDCGYFQERDFVHRNWEPFAVEPGTIDAVLLTHAHLDHCGLLPRLVSHGFHGKVFGTEATTDIATIVMLDSGRIQEEDVRYKEKRHKREGRTAKHPYEPLYTVSDVEKTTRLLESVPFDEPVTVADGITATWSESGHILGAGSIKLSVNGNGGAETILFSGDIGREGMPILRDPTRFHQADYLVCESTYGDRNHEDNSRIPDELEQIITRTMKAGGNIVIPSFAVERSQDLLYHLSELRAAKRIPHLLVFLDSPMAINVTKVFRKHPDLFDEETVAQLEDNRHPCDFPGLNLSKTVEQSKAINRIRGTVIIIAGSGMCTGGRIKHHLKANIDRPESTILFVGYQAEGTLGRHILRKPEKVRIHGEERPLRAAIEQVGGFSGHADQGELMHWLSGFEAPPKKVFITHGEPKASSALAELIKEKHGYETVLPDYRDSFDLS